MAEDNIYYGCLTVHGFKQLDKVFVARTRKGICFIELLAQHTLSFRAERGIPLRLLRLRLAMTAKLTEDDTAFNDIRDAFTSYFAGKITSFDVPVDLSRGTPFQQRVWRKLMEIPYGEVRTYKWVAKEIGLPAGVRAVGQACGSNSVPIIIPCHRIIRTDGGLGGFSSGITVKKQLLKLEGVSRGTLQRAPT